MNTPPKAPKAVYRTFQAGQEHAAATWALAGPRAGEDRRVHAAPGFDAVKWADLMVAGSTKHAT